MGAKSKQVEVGDTIVSANYQDIRNMSQSQVTQLLGSFNGRDMILEVKRTVIVSRNPRPSVPSAAQTNLPTATRSAVSVSRPVSSAAPVSSSQGGKPKPPPQGTQARRLAAGGKAVPVKPAPDHRHLHPHAPQSEREAAKEAHHVRDPEGEAKVGELALTISGKYVDPEFPTTLRSLTWSGSSGVDAAQGLADAGMTALRWMRPEEMDPKGDPGAVFVDGVMPDDIQQGALGNCYFLAACAACATNTRLISDLIVEDHADKGIYGVKMYYEGKWHTIIVDDQIPVQANRDSPWSCRWNPKNPKETWVMIAEKAWSKLHGCYANTAGGFPGDSMVYLTGGFRENFKTETALEQLWDKGHQALANDTDEAPVFCVAGASLKHMQKHVQAGITSSEMRDKYGLGANHAYSILQMEVIPGGTKLLKIRNPWGKSEWTGEWHDGDPRWTPELRQLLNMPEGEVNDGVYCLDLNTFAKFFSNLEIVRCFPPEMPFSCCRDDFPDQQGKLSWKLETDSRTVYIQFEQPDNRTKEHDGVVMRAIHAEVKDQTGKVLWPPEGHFFYSAVRTYGLDFEVDVTKGPFEVSLTYSCQGKANPDTSIWCQGWAKKGLTLSKWTGKHIGGCLQCGELISQGSYFTYEGGKVHADCHDQYRNATADKCLQCNGPVTGTHYNIKTGGKVHAEGSCWSAYKESH